MKKIKMILVAGFLLFISENILPTKATAQVSVNFQVFYDNLSPYGNWVSYPGYGYAWVPRYGGFRPYVTGGHWVFTDLGWTWVSDYDWGWAPFHYGSWVDDPSYGWLWVPGYDWAPAWVVWGTYGDYYGWAPVAPGFSISIGYHPPIDYWCFSQPRYIAAGNFGNNYYVATGGRISIGSNTPITTVNNITVVNNTNNYGGQRFNAGPPRENFERAAKTSIQPVAIKESTRPGKATVNGGSVEVFRPKVNAGDRNSAKPSTITPLENIKSEKGNVKSNNEAPASKNTRSIPQRSPQNNPKDINVTPSEKNNPAVKPNRQLSSPQEEKQQPSQSRERKMIPEKQVAPQERKQPAQPQQQRVAPPERQAIPQERKQEQSRPQQVSPPERQSIPQERKQQPQQREQRQMVPRERQPHQSNQPQQEMRQRDAIPPPTPNPESSDKREPKGHGPK